MCGRERERMEERVWGGEEGEGAGLETVLGEGEAVLIPRGWWHAVRSVESGRLDGEGEGGMRRAELSASVNWWFR